MTALPHPSAARPASKPLPRWTPVAILLLLGFQVLSLMLPEPAFLALLPTLLMVFLRPMGAPPSAGVVLVASLAMTILPALLGFLLAWSRPAVPGVRPLVTTLTGSAVVLALLDLPGQVLISGLTTDAAAGVRLLVAATILAATVLLGSLAAQALGRANRRRRLVNGVCLVVILGACLWSWAVFAAASSGAASIAGRDPYCIANARAERPDYRPIASVLLLRGSHLFTDRTGYKDTSRWYFNGLLLVRREEGIAYYNWSIRSWRFDRLPADRFIAPIRGACEPRPGFLRSLLGLS